MDSKRLATMKALTTHLFTEITTAHGYAFDFTAANVVRGRAHIDDDDVLPMVSILEGLNPDRFPAEAGDADGEAPVQRDNWILLLQGWVEDDKKNPTDPAYELMAAVKKALSKLLDIGDPTTGAPKNTKYLLNGLILGLKMEPGTVRPPDQNSSKAYFWMRVIIKFSENVRDPFDYN